MHVALELRRREDLLEERAQLDLGPGAARLDVGEHALEVADAGREALHLPQPLLHRLELVADELERLAEALLERGLELLVDGDAHLLELLLVAGLELDEARVDGGAHAVQGLAVGVGHLAEPLGDAVELGALHLGHGVELRRELHVAVGEAARELDRGPRARRWPTPRARRAAPRARRRRCRARRPPSARARRRAAPRWPRPAAAPARGWNRSCPALQGCRRGWPPGMEATVSMVGEGSDG